MLENILMEEAGDLSTVKIADFGLSAQVDSRSSNNVKAQCGTLLYMAPEIFRKKSYSPKAGTYLVTKHRLFSIS